jgi:hypothetical protein
MQRNASNAFFLLAKPFGADQALELALVFRCASSTLLQ